MRLVAVIVCTYIHCVHPCITTTSCLKTDRQNLCQQAIVLTKHQNSLPCSFHILDVENAHSTGAVVPVAWMTNIHILPQAQLPCAMHHHHRRMLHHAMHPKSHMPDRYDCSRIIDSRLWQAHYSGPWFWRIIWALQEEHCSPCQAVQGWFWGEVRRCGMCQGWLQKLCK